MAFGAGSTGSSASEINVTPLIDVLLVLLIIFMVIVPVAPKGLDAVVPQLPLQQQVHDDSAIVVEVRGDAGAPSYSINETYFSRSALESRLASILATQRTKVVFVQGDPAMEYGEIADAIDLDRKAGADNIGIITPAASAIPR